jgi:hypothetical protein
MEENLMTPQALDPKVTYEQVGQSYRKFLDWREKIIGGYVAVIGGLGLGYDRSTRMGFRSLLLVGAVLTSLAFWILNMRNSKFIVTCVRAGRDLENGHGVYSKLESLIHTSRLTHGLAVNLLVFGVVVGSVFGLWVTKECWWQMKYLWPAVVCVAMFLLLIVVAEIVGDPNSKRSTRRLT